MVNIPLLAKANEQTLTHTCIESSRYIISNRAIENLNLKNKDE